jgi:hypothetical protein
MTSGVVVTSPGTVVGAGIEVGRTEVGSTELGVTEPGGVDSGAVELGAGTDVGPGTLIGGAVCGWQTSLVQVTVSVTTIVLVPVIGRVIVSVPEV